MHTENSTKKYITKKLALYATTAFVLSVHTAFGNEPVVYSPFVEIPGFDYGTSDFTAVVNQIYTLLIVIGSLYAVLRISYSGVEFAMSDKVGTKENATSNIRGVLLGLAILLIPFIVLNTINSDLTKLNIFENGFGTIDVGKGSQNTAPEVVSWDPNADIKTTSKESLATCLANPDTAWVNNFYGSGASLEQGPEQCAPKSNLQNKTGCRAVSANVYNCTDRTKPNTTFSITDTKKAEGCILGLSTQVDVGGYTSCAEN